MRTLYIEGVATHDGPESCVGVCEGVGEALTGVRAGQLLSREINGFGVPTLLSRTEGHIPGGVMRNTVDETDEICAMAAPMSVPGWK